MVRQALDEEDWELDMSMGFQSEVVSMAEQVDYMAFQAVAGIVVDLDFQVAADLVLLPRRPRRPRRRPTASSRTSSEPGALHASLAEALRVEVEAGRLTTTTTTRIRTSRRRAPSSPRGWRRCFCA